MILVSGVIVRHFFGHEIVRVWERMLSRVPVARSIYAGVKQLFEAVVQSGSAPSYNRVILIEYPRRGLWALAFTTGAARGPVADALPKEQLVNCFVPTTPNPTSGFYLVIPESDVQLAFASEGQVTPRLDPTAAARLAADRFGATGVLLGVVDRYREREGSSFGSFASASAEFEVTLYGAPGGRKIWTGRFNQTQPSLTSNLFTAARYPGGGFRFLTVAELARWGAQLIAEKLPIVPARSD